MATHTYPSSITNSNYSSYFQMSYVGSSWYNRQTGSSGNKILAAGTTNAGNDGVKTKYSSYLYISGSEVKEMLEGTNNVPQKLTQVNFYIPVDTSYNGSGYWDVGLSTSAPSAGIEYVADNSNFKIVASHLSAAKDSILNVTISASDWGSYSSNKWLLITQSKQRGTSYGYQQIVANNGTPTATNKICPCVVFTHQDNYTKMGIPSNVAISGDSIKKPEPETFILSWTKSTDGQNQALSGYIIQQKIGSGSWEDLYTDIASTATSQIIKVPNNRGQQISYRIQAKGSAGSSYYSDYSAVKSFTVNSIPNKPTISGTVGLKSGGGEVEILVVNNGDAQSSQTLKLQYSTNNSTWNDFTSPFTDTITETTTFYFRVSDGLEACDSVTWLVTVNEKPNATINFSPTEISGVKMTYNGKEYSLSRGGSFSLEERTNNVISCQWFSLQSPNCSDLDETDIGFSSLNRLEIGSDTNVYSYSNKTLGINSGHFYRLGAILTSKIKLKSTDLSETVEKNIIYLDASKIEYSPYTPDQVSNVSTINDALIENEFPSLFNNGLRVSWTNPQSKAGYANIKQIDISYKLSNTTKLLDSFSDGNYITFGANNTTELNLSEINRGEKINLEIKITDVTNNVATYTYGSTLQRVLPYDFNNCTISISKSVIKPHTDGAVILSVTKPSTSTTNKLKCKSSIIISNNSYNEEFDLTDYTDETNTDATVYFFTSIKTPTIPSILKNLINNDTSIDNNLYNTSVIKIYAQDAFGNVTSFQNTRITEVNYIESPYFETGISFSTEVVVKNNFISSDKIAFPEDSIKFTLTSQASDYNNDIINYRVEYLLSDSIDSEYKDKTGWKTFKNFTKEELVYINQIGIIGSTVDQTKNQYIYFRIFAIDEKNNISDSPIYQNDSVIIKAVRSKPTINLLSIASIKSDEKGYLQLTSKLVDFGSGTNLLYDNIKSFERKLATLEKIYFAGCAILMLESSTDNKIFSEVWRETLYDNIINTVETSPNNLSNFKNEFTRLTTVLSPDKGKLYCRVRIKIFTSIEIIDEEVAHSEPIEAISNTVIYYPQTPTLSLRSNYVGINTETFGDTEVFVITPNEDRKVIVLNGVGDSEGKAIQINLDTLEIINSVISGGTWD